MSNARKVRCNTKIPVKTIVFEWTIRNWEFAAIGDDDFVRSPPFPHGPDTSVKFYLDFYPRGYEGSLLGYRPKICLVLNSPLIWLLTNISQIGADVHITAFRGNRDRRFRISKKANFVAVNSNRIEFLLDLKTWLKEALDTNVQINCKIKMAISKRYADTVVKDSEVMIYSPLPVSAGSIIEESDEEDYPQKCREKLISDMNDLVSSSDNSDLIIEVEGEEVRAHRAILCARSSVFNAMLRAGGAQMMESRTGRVKLAYDVTVEAWKVFQKYLYTGEVFLDVTLPLSETTIQVLGLSDMYDCEELKNYLENRICKLLKSESFLESENQCGGDSVLLLLNLAANYRMAKLKPMCFGRLGSVFRDRDSCSVTRTSQPLVHLVNNRKNIHEDLVNLSKQHPELMAEYLEYQNKIPA